MHFSTTFQTTHSSLKPTLASAKKSFLLPKGSKKIRGVRISSLFSSFRTRRSSLHLLLLRSFVEFLVLECDENRVKNVFPFCVAQKKSHRSWYRIFVVRSRNLKAFFRNLEIENHATQRRALGAIFSSLFSKPALGPPLWPIQGFRLIMRRKP